MKLDLFPNKRNLKIYYGHSRKKYTKHPMIRFGGKYLEAMDYKIGDSVDITIDADRIVIIKKQPPIAPSETEPGSAEAQPARDILA